MTTKILAIAVGALLIVVFFLCLKMGKLADSNTHKDQQILALNDTIKYSKDALGDQLALTTQFRTENMSNFIKLQTQDSTLKKLQVIVKTNKNRLNSGGSATIFDSQTTIKSSGVTKVVPKDSNNVIRGDTTFKYPEYQSLITLGKWVDAIIIANKDSIHLNETINNEYSIILGEEASKTGLLHIFDKKTPFAEVTNYNPYSSTKTLKSYQVSLPPAKTWGIGVTGGVGVQKTNNHITTGPQITVGLTKTFIRF